MKKIDQLTNDFPDPEKYGLVAPMRRAPVSVPSNGAEGQARHSTKEFVPFVSHAEGSMVEWETPLILAVELGYGAKSEAAASFELITALRKVLNALRRTLVTRH